MSESSEEEVPGTFQPHPSKFATTRAGLSSDSESGDDASVASRRSSPDLLGTEPQPSSNVDKGDDVTTTDNVQNETVDDRTNNESNVDNVNDNNNTTKKNRLPNFTSDEVLLVSRSFMQVSSDPTVGTDQNRGTFWKRIHLAYIAMVNRANSLHHSAPNFKQLPTERSDVSIKNMWYKKILPATQKFQALCGLFPPPSGYLENDPEMNLYYEQMLQQYKDSAKTFQKNDQMPKDFSLFLKSYMYLKTHPKFAAVSLHGIMQTKG
jgi:hypothetical protein